MTKKRDPEIQRAMDLAIAHGVCPMTVEENIRKHTAEPDQRAFYTKMLEEAEQANDQRGVKVAQARLAALDDPKMAYQRFTTPEGEYTFHVGPDVEEVFIDGDQIPIPENRQIKLKLSKGEHIVRTVPPLILSSQRKPPQEQS